MSLRNSLDSLVPPTLLVVCSPWLKVILAGWHTDQILVQELAANQAEKSGYAAKTKRETERRYSQKNNFSPLNAVDGFVVLLMYNHIIEDAFCHP